MPRRAVSMLLSSRWAPVGVLAVGLGFTAAVAGQLSHAARERDRQRFHNVVQRLQDAVNQKMEGYLALLRATAGLAAAEDGQTTPEEFRAFAGRLDLPTQYAGLQALGFLRRVPPDAREAFERDVLIPRIGAGIRVREGTTWDGRSDALVIVLSEPHNDRNNKSVGFDAASVPDRRAAMERARDAGRAAVSPRVFLVGEPGAGPDRQPGFVIYVPVYQTGSEGPPETAADRRRALIGYAYSPFRAGTLFQNVFATVLPAGEPADAVVAVYDNPSPGDRPPGDRAAGDRAAAADPDADERLFYQSGAPVPGRPARFEQRVDLSPGGGGGRWALVVRSTPAFEAGSLAAGLVAPAAAGGVVVTLLLTALTALQTRARHAAERERSAAARSAAAARTAVDRLDLVLQASRVGLWYSTLPFGALEWDERVRTHFFMSADEPVTIESAFARVHPDDRERIRAAMGWSIREHAPFDVEYRTVSPDGSRAHWIRSIGQTFVDEASGRAVRFDVLTIDVTALKAGQEALAESEAKFRQLANSIPQLAWMARPDGWISWFNQRWLDYTGATHWQAEGLGWQQSLHPDAAAGVVGRWQDAVATGRAFEAEFPLRAADGTYGWFLTRAVPVRDAGGNVLFWFGTNTDVTSQRRLAEEREQLLASERAARGIAERAGRLKDEFLATLSHELRTPLNAILGWVQILRLQLGGAIPAVSAGGGPAPAALLGEVAEGVAVIERNARAQAQLVSDLLDMSRVIEGKLRIDLQPVDPAAVVAAAVASARPAADAKGVILEPDLDPSVGPVRADAGRLQQVVWNLLSNAVKFTPKGGRVRVTLGRDGAWVRLAVADSGEGIRPEFLPHLFERFRQADASTTRRHGGLGLGLAIVKSLVELHGGRCAAASDGPGTGATLTVELPAPEPAAAEVSAGPDAVAPVGEADAPADAAGPSSSVVPAAAVAATDRADALAGLTVLVVEDDADARDLVRRMLAGAGAAVRTADGAEAGLAVVRRDRPDVIVSDIGMPGRDGYQFIAAVRALGPAGGGAAPAVALTAFARPEDRRRALDAGYQRHVAKPVEAADLVAAVAALAGREPAGAAGAAGAAAGEREPTAEPAGV